MFPVENVRENWSGNQEWAIQRNWQQVWHEVNRLKQTQASGAMHLFLFSPLMVIQVRRVWRYQRGNQNPHIEEEQTTQWPKEKIQKDKQRSTKHTYKTKDRVTRTPLNTGGKLRFSGRVSSSCSTSDTRDVNLVTNPVITSSSERVEIHS
jgi:hypothetical protein